jgi:hypothetical protein
MAGAREQDDVVMRGGDVQGAVDAALDRKRPPAYLRPDHQLYRDWFPAQQLRRALLQELKHA